MISRFLKKIFGSRNDRLIKQYSKTVHRINALEPAMQVLSDEALRAKTDEFRERHAKGETLDDLLPEAFAVVREAGVRVLGMRHFDVQLIGGMVLHHGKIAEMRTGEGKTLMATLPAYLNAMSDKGVHIVTVNDYLASRDAEWMGRLHRFLGLSVGVNLSQMSHDDKQAAYRSDITYGTNNEFGFDYLRDNMVYSPTERVQRGLSFAIVDEVDSILIDEARTPLIISGQAEDRTELYLRMNAVPPLLTIGEAAKSDGEADTGEYTVDLKSHQVLLTEAGHEKAEEVLTRLGMLPEGSSLYEPANIMLMHHLYAALRAHNLYHRDQQYVVQDGEVIIVDEFTGRLMAGRRWSDGLHQAVEAKEGVTIQSENQTLASITFQNYFRMYGKLSGMTGTADTEAYEFHSIYGLETVVIPTNQPMIRKDENDQIYRTAKEKYTAIIADIRACQKRGQPVLVGTTSIENSELLSGLLEKEKLPHQVLNAKQHAREAEIVVQAGRPGVITIATNMAGRGTDIVLGGNIEKPVSAVADAADLSAEEKTSRIAELRAAWQIEHNKVTAAGGLHIIGSERHESRNFDIRKQLLEYDDVSNDQRKVIYQQRNDLMNTEDISETISAMRQGLIHDNFRLYVPAESVEEQWDVSGLEAALSGELQLNLPVAEWVRAEPQLTDDDILKRLLDAADAAYAEKVARVDIEAWRGFERNVMLQSLDTHWREHLAALDHLRQGIHLRGYAQKNPKQEYKREAFELFETLLQVVRTDVTRLLMTVEVRSEEQIEQAEVPPHLENVQYHHADYDEALASPDEGEPRAAQPIERHAPKIGRNDPCPCGSGKKYKHCHGKLS